MTTLETLIQQSQKYDELKHDLKLRPGSVRFDDGRFVVPGPMGDTGYFVEDWAFGQMAQKLNVPTQYARRCPPNLIDANFNHWPKAAGSDHKTNKPMLVRTSGDNVRAFLSHAYRPVGNTELLEMVAEMMIHASYRLLRPDLGRDGLHLRVLVLENTGPDNNYGFGAYLHNGETGNRGLKVAPFMMRTSCTNSTVWGKQAVNIRHAWHGLEWIRGSVKKALGEAFKCGSEMIDAVLKAESEQIEDLDIVIAKLAKRHGMTDRERSLVMLGTEGFTTRMGVVNGLTNMSQQLDDQDRTLFLRKSPVAF